MSSRGTQRCAADSMLTAGLLCTLWALSRSVHGKLADIVLR